MEKKFVDMQKQMYNFDKFIAFNGLFHSLKLQNYRL